MTDPMQGSVIEKIEDNKKKQRITLSKENVGKPYVAVIDLS